MQVYKLRGTIDATGNLVVLEPLDMPPGDVEIIVWTVADAVKLASESKSAIPETKFKTKVKAFQAWFDNTQPVPPDFDAEEARWEALKEKHNL